MTLEPKLFNLKNTSETSSIFFGEDPGLFDTIDRPYPDLWRIYKNMKSLDWDENEFDYSSCVADFQTCPPEDYHEMIKTLAWQWEGDSLASRSIIGVLAPVITNSEAFAAWMAISTNECVTGDHEVLTPQGWKRIDRIRYDDLVAQYNLHRREITFVRPDDIITKHHTGDLIQFRDTDNVVIQATTPSHRMPYTGTALGEGVTYAQATLYGKGVHLPASGLVPRRGEGLSAKEKLYIAVHAEGAPCVDPEIDTPDGGGLYRAYFGDSARLTYFLELCDEAGWTVKEQGANYATVAVPSTDYIETVRQLDWFDLRDVTQEWVASFIQEIQYWGGNVLTDDDTFYSTTLPECADRVQALIHLSGHTTRARRCALNNVTTIELVQDPVIAGDHITRDVVPYDGLVYCLTVPDTYFLVRHNGVVSVTGNCLHAATYSEIVRCSFDDPRTIKAEILSVREAQDRLRLVGEVMSKAYSVSHRYALRQIEPTQEAYNAIFMFVVALFVLERIQFPASFAVTFALARTGRFMPIAKAVQKIAQDEFEVHVEMGKAVLRHELKTHRGQVAFAECRGMIKSLVEEVLQSELRWVETLYPDPTQVGDGIRNQTKMKAWASYCARPIFQFFELPLPPGIPAENPLPFMGDWIDISKIQASPQEEQNGAYRVNILRRDDDDVEFAVDF